MRIDRKILELTGRDFKWGGRDVVPVFLNLSAGTAHQDRFRFYADDGAENAQTALAAIDANYDAGTKAANFQLCVRIQVHCGGSSDVTIVPRPYCSHNGGAYFLVTTSSSIIKQYDSTNLTNGGATTEQLAGGGAFEAGEVIEDGAGASHVINNENDTEYLFTMETIFTDMAAGANTYDFRVRNTATELDEYAITPRLTVTKSAGGVPLRMLMGVGT